MKRAIRNPRGVRRNGGRHVIIAVEVAAGKVVYVHPIAWRDCLRRKADDVTEFDDRLTQRERPNRDLVPHGNVPARGHDDVAECNLFAFRQIARRNAYVVVGVKSHNLRRGACHSD